MFTGPRLGFQKRAWTIDRDCPQGEKDTYTTSPQWPATASEAEISVLTKS